MPMSFDGLAASSSGCAIRPRERETGSTGYVGRTPSSLPTGLYVMATAEHREPCESRGSCTVLGAPGGEIPPGDSTKAVTSTSHSPWWDMERHSPWSRHAFAWALAGASVKAGRRPPRGVALTEARGHSRWQA